MTLAIALHDTANPIFLSDVLITSSKIRQPTLHISMPGLHAQAQATEFNAHISGFRQKLHVIGNNIILQWSGIAASGLALKREIEKLICKDHTADDVIELASQWNDEQDFSYLISFRFQDSDFFVFNNFEPYQISQYMNLTFSGSGIGDAVRILSPAEDTDGTMFYSGKLRQLNSLQKALNLEGVFLSDILTNSNILSNSWGGITEAAYRDEIAGYKKLENVAYFFSFIAQQDEKIVMATNPLVIVKFYIDDHLFIIEYNENYPEPIYYCISPNGMQMTDWISKLPPLGIRNIPITHTARSVTSYLPQHTTKFIETHNSTGLFCRLDTLCMSNLLHQRDCNYLQSFHARALGCSDDLII